MLVATEVASRLSVDPLGQVPRDASILTQEIASFMCAGLAFGNLKAIGNSVSKVVRNLDKPEQLKQVTHRWVRGGDIAAVVAQIQHLQAQYGSLGSAFEQGYERGDMRGSLIRFSALLREGLVETRGSYYLTSTPATGSACKRLNLFMRWMVRADAVDLGLWTQIDRRDLMMPLDVHVLKFVNKEGLTTRKSVDWKMAEEVTSWFRRLCPDDPLRYDFAISHYGMVYGWDNRTQVDKLQRHES